MFVCLQDDNKFTTTLNLRLFGNQIVEDNLYQVAKTCPYDTFASRDIVCDTDYMEASDCCRALRLCCSVYHKWAYFPLRLTHPDVTA